MSRNGPPAGFPLPYALQSLRTFLDEGDLERLLQQMTLLPEGRLDVRVELTTLGPRGLTVSAWVGESSRELTIEAKRMGEEALEPLAAVMRTTNELLAERGAPERFVIRRLPPEGDRKLVYAVQLLSGDRLTDAVEASWEAAACVEGVELEQSRVESLRPPSLPGWQDTVPPSRRFGGDHTLRAFLARLTEGLAELAGLQDIRCLPVESRGDSFGGSQTVALRIVEGIDIVSEQTLKVPVAPAPDLRPILDYLDGRLAQEGSDLRFAVVRDQPEDAIVLVSPAEARELERLGHLMPPPGRRLLERLADAGFVLDHGGEARYLAGWEGTLRKLRHLLRTLGHELEWADVGWGFIPMRLDGDLLLRLEDEEEEEPPLPLAELLPSLNGRLSDLGDDARLVIVRGEPVWDGPRVVLVDPAWVNALVRLDPSIREALESKWEPPTTPPVPAGVPPAVPRIRDIVPPAAIHESDLECSARSEDLPGVVAELAAFAEVDLEIARLAKRAGDEDGWTVAVTFDGETTELPFTHHKYARVGSVLDYLNGVLHERGRAERLYPFVEARYASGVLLADDAQADQLRDLGYI